MTMLPQGSPVSSALFAPSSSPHAHPCLHLQSHEFDPLGDADVILFSGSKDPQEHTIDFVHLDADGFEICESEQKAEICEACLSHLPLEHLEFYVHSSILSLASPLFKKMFSNSQHTRHQSYHCTRIPLLSSRSTLSTLLRFLYPLPDPELATLDEIIEILTVALRYELTIVLNSCRKQLIEDKFLKNDSVRVFAIAARFNLEEEIKIASRHTLRMSLMDNTPSTDLKHISAHTYHRLLALHHQRATSAESLLKLPYNIKCPQCNTGHAMYNGPKWWYEFLKKAQAELRVRPDTNVIFGQRFLFDVVVGIGCDKCPASFLEAGKYLEEMKKEIDSLPNTI